MISFELLKILKYGFYTYACIQFTGIRTTDMDISITILTKMTLYLKSAILRSLFLKSFLFTLIE